MEVRTFPLVEKLLKFRHISGLCLSHRHLFCGSFTIANLPNLVNQTPVKQKIPCKSMDFNLPVTCRFLLNQTKPSYLGVSYIFSFFSQDLKRRIRGTKATVSGGFCTTLSPFLSSGKTPLHCCNKSILLLTDRFLYLCNRFHFRI